MRYLSRVGGSVPIKACGGPIRFGAKNLHLRVPALVELTFVRRFSSARTRNPYNSVLIRY